MNILLVDDDSFLRDMYTTKFKEGGHEVSSAATGEEGIKAVKENDYDVVLLDMVMPGIDGLEFLQAVMKEQSKESNTKFIVLSNQGEEYDKTAAKQAGAHGYLVKAESIPSDVVKKVEALCGEGGKK